MKITKRIFAAVLCGAMTVGMMAGCGKEKTSTDATYTYNYYTTSAAIQTLNPHEWQFTDEYTIMSLTQRGLYDIIYTDDANSDYAFINEMAAAAPVDITEQYAGNETYGVPADATEGYAFQIKLREDAQWDDGTPINADTYIYSMKQILDPAMSNYRATTYTEGTYEIANAYEYYCAGEPQYVHVYNVDTEEYADVEGVDLYTSVTQKTVFFDESLEDALNDWGAEYFIGEDGTDTYAALAEAIGDNDWALVEGDVADALNALVDAFNYNYGMDRYDEEITEFCTYLQETESATWDEVGLIKDDDYTITYIFDKPCTSEYMVYYGFTFNWLVKEDLYEANKKDAGGLTKTTYGTSVDSYASYGPYKLTSWQLDKELVIEKNENWYGYSDKAFEGQYQATKIVYQIIDEHATALQLFLQGNLDYIVLNSDDIETYGTSDYALFTPTSYTYKLSFNTDYDALKSRETAGVNKTIITYKDFRKAVALSIDRSEFCQAVKPASDPAYGLLNENYIYDTSTFAVYRNTDAAKNTLMDVYEADSYDEITGYNSEAAKEFFQKAYDEAVAAGDLKETDKIVIDFTVTTNSDFMQKSVNFINDAIAAASAGTSLEGKISLEIKETDDYYAAMAAGTADAIYSAWGGSEADPYSMLQCYVDIAYFNDGEHGFDATKDYTATIDGTEYTMSYYDWYFELCKGSWATAAESVKLEVLAAVEKGVLEEYCAIPIWSECTAEMLSRKVSYISYDYNPAIMDTYGGYRFMKFNYSDEEWAAYCAEQNNQLTY